MDSSMSLTSDPSPFHSADTISSPVNLSNGGGAFLASPYNFLITYLTYDNEQWHFEPHNPPKQMCS